MLLLKQEKSSQTKVEHFTKPKFPELSRLLSYLILPIIFHVLAAFNTFPRCKFLNAVLRNENYNCNYQISQKTKF